VKLIVGDVGHILLCQQQPTIFGLLKYTVYEPNIFQLLWHKIKK